MMTFDASAEQFVFSICCIRLPSVLFLFFFLFIMVDDGDVFGDLNMLT